MQEQLTIAERNELLRIARESIAAHFKSSPQPELSIDSKRLRGSGGSFVTLHNKDGSLRGCIGNFVSTKPLYITVREMALQAAFHDPRFYPLDEDELSGVQIEISVLSPLKEIKNTEEIEVGRHGIYIMKGLRAGTLLPQVAAEHGWDRAGFLEHTCLKAGLSPDAWKDGAKILIYTAEVISESGEK